MTLCSRSQIDGEDFINFCGLHGKYELYNQDVSSEIMLTHYVALSKILYSAGGFQDFLNSLKNAVLMPANAKKIIKKLATRWSHVLGPILIDYLTSTYSLIWKIQNQKTKKDLKLLVIFFKAHISEKATKFWEIFTLLLTGATLKTKVRWRFCKILWLSQNMWTLCRMSEKVFGEMKWSVAV